jgi:UDP-N-acetyl-D-mannosaminuronate dehydrogenase
VSLDGLPSGDAVILQAYHDQYRSLEWNALPALDYKVVLDGRNSLDRAVIEAAGLRYLGIGR